MPEEISKNSNTEKIEKGLKRESILLSEEPLTEEKAKIILEDPNLFNYIIEEELSKQIVGEKNTCHTVFLCSGGGRLVKNAKHSSYNLIVNDITGSGKDWVVDHVLNIIPKENVVKRTRITENVFTYWHNPKHEPEWSWNDKVFYNEDVSNSVLNSDVFKVMASSGSKATVLFHQTPIDIEIKGKPVMIVTTANPHLRPENIRRFNIVNLDTTIDQTKAIIERQAKYAKSGKNIEYDEKIIEAQKYLKRIKVKIPYAEKLIELFPIEHVSIRTHFERFLDYIKASCAFHQYQREIDDEGYHLAEPQDYNIARIALLKTTSNPLMIPLTKDEIEIIEKMKELDEQSYSINELEQYVTSFSSQWLRILLDRLTGYGFLKKDREEREDLKQKVMTYKLIPFTIINIPLWKDINNYTKDRKNKKDIKDIKDIKVNKKGIKKFIK